MVSKLVCFSVVTLFTALAPVQAGSPAATNANPPKVAPASGEAARAINRFRLQPGMRAELFAAEPLLANPICFAIDERGRCYVAETFRLNDGVTDIRAHMDWLNDELASTSVGERVRYMKKHEGKGIAAYTRQSDRVRLVWDKDGDGRADTATVFADGFNDIADGLGAGLLPYRGNVYYANIPNLWMLRDPDNSGIATAKRSLFHGFGVREGFIGHDLHGLRIGPDGKLYFSIGDRGAHVVTQDRRDIMNPEDGVVYRCDLDGSDLEIFARGLRNPQELAFDEFGNLWTGDGSSDGGDSSRWVYVVQDGDSGWRIGYQFITSPSRGPWLTERMCYPYWPGQPAYIVPPIANIGNGPAGLTYYPGEGLPARYNGHFFMADFRGTPDSGILSFAAKARGAGFDLVDRQDFIWGLLPTDCDFGYDGCLYVSDWVDGWTKTGKGRIYRFYDPVRVKEEVVKDVKRLFARGIHTMTLSDIIPLLSHRDMRVRQEAQFAIAEKGPAVATQTFRQVLLGGTNRFARIHAVWGLGQVARKYVLTVDVLNRAILDKDPEIRAQAVKVLGENRRGDMRDMTHLLVDESPRVRFFAAQALGKIGQLESMTPIIEMVRADEGKDPYLRHAGVAALANILRSTNGEPLAVTSKKFALFENACADTSDSVRMASLLALRRIESPAITLFLKDRNPLLVAEAARAINDLPITNALPLLAALIGDADTLLAFPIGNHEHPGPRDAVLSRVLNANYRVGESNNAAALAAVALNAKVPEWFRTEAVTMLGEWARPSSRDRITGLWRPLPWRDPVVAAGALKPVLGGLQSGPGTLRLAAAKAAGRLKVQEVGWDFYDLARDTNAPADLRIEALRSLALQVDARVTNAVRMALTDPNEQVRQEAATIQAQLEPASALETIRTTLASGSIREKQNAFNILAGMNNPAADDVLARWMDKLLTNAVAPELALDLLYAAGKSTNAALRAQVERYDRVRPGTDDLRTWRECLVGGDAEQGKSIFFERADVECFRCHKFNGEGGDFGPELTGIGSRKSRDYILESIVYPNKQITPGYETSIITMKTGNTYAGPIKEQTAETLDINTPEDGVVRVLKSEIKTRDRGLSAMPEGLKQLLTARDVRNLVEFLATAKEKPAATAPAPTPAPATNAPAAPKKTPPPAE